MPFRARFDCLWCGTPHAVRTPEDLERPDSELVDGRLWIHADRRLLVLDAMNMRFRELKLKRDPACPVCGEHPTITELIDYHAFCGVPPTARVS